ncbi:hypothetical protein ENUP19_0002G0072 [Entamoeba nuttalli]|uniref:Leucine-rich repeat containing protein n=2 Tax=Entamoeba nuttalli TaxID=412467 RepID=K2H5A8_ENTNP|nr:hypothetical protein ENU1_011460 [Entamoeba nuttalli P19]EKE42753.1 hypothetical protein ENU1_011460 [Entamoeba nuttalli P19]|eukprot:XP_008854917.1 hypothetical protein ENU1_011460 [Entamoeba nuttalli P19]
MKVQLEHLYLLNVVLYLDYMNARRFALINSKCLNATHCLLRNPNIVNVEGESKSSQLSSKTKGIIGELRTFDGIQTLSCDYEVLLNIPFTLIKNVQCFNLSLKLLQPFDLIKIKEYDITDKITELTLFIYTNVDTRFDFTRFKSLRRLHINYGFNVNEQSLELISPILNVLPHFTKLIIECAASGVLQFLPYIKQLNKIRIEILLRVIGLKDSIYNELKEIHSYCKICSVFNNISPFLINHSIPLLIDQKKLFIIAPDIVETDEVESAWNLYYPSKVSIFGNKDLFTNVKELNLSHHDSLIDLSLSRIHSYNPIQLSFPASLRSLSFSCFNVTPFPSLSSLKIEELKVNDCSTVVSLCLPTTLTKLYVFDCERLTEIIDLNNEKMRDLKISCPSVKMIVPYVSKKRLKKYYNKVTSNNPVDILVSQRARQCMGKTDNFSDVELPTSNIPLVRRSFVSINC